ncbi:sigma-70 family RNA polymerase sigma factor [Chryseolinea sp. T2]|uniref:RNA polymerase sigma factor n=1 Tax=Chryseolinea sp. T2 TaxID=3129255 RepID=UPI00307894EE
MSDDIKNWEGLIHGDENAFAKLYESYFKLLYNYGRKICSERARVEDCIHDLFVDLWRYRENLSSTTSVRFYLYRALRRKLVKQKENAMSLYDDTSFIDEVLRLSTQSQEYDIIESESKDQKSAKLKKLLNDLSPRQFEALVLYFYDEFSYEEIASILNVNTQSARNLVQRGLVQLRDYAKHIVSIGLFLFFLLS